MAKRELSLENMFGKVMSTKEQSQKVVEIDNKDTDEIKQPSLQGKQGKLAKQEKKYDYGTKHTFPIPDDLWQDALILMQLKGLKQVEFIQELIRCELEKNQNEINAIKKMRGAK